MRLLNPDEREHSISEIIDYSIGVLYFFGKIYSVNGKHLLRLFQMFMNYLDDNENEEQYKAISYTLYKYPTYSHGVLDAWIIIRNTFFYILSLFVLFIVTYLIF